jgi:lysophospholipase
LSELQLLTKPLGASSNLFSEVCVPIPAINTTDNTFTGLAQDLAALVDQIHAVGTREEYAVYLNPFYNYSHSSPVSAQTELDLADGGLALQNNPIWPLLHRDVDVIIVNDNSADSNNFPNGSEILTTYVQSLSAGLTRMPVIPPVATFLSEGLNRRSTFSIRLSSTFQTTTTPFRATNRPSSLGTRRTRRSV